MVGAISKKRRRSIILFRWWNSELETFASVAG